MPSLPGPDCTLTPSLPSLAAGEPRWALAEPCCHQWKGAGKAHLLLPILTKRNGKSCKVHELNKGYADVWFRCFKWDKYCSFMAVWGEGWEGKDFISPLLTATSVMWVPTDLTQERNGFGWDRNYAEYVWLCNKLHISIITQFWITGTVKCFSDFYFADCRKSEKTYQGSIYSLDLVWVRSSYNCWSGAITAAKTPFHLRSCVLL